MTQRDSDPDRKDVPIKDSADSEAVVMPVLGLLLLDVLAHDADGRPAARASEVVGRPAHAFPVSGADFSDWRNDPETPWLKEAPTHLLQ